MEGEEQGVSTAGSPRREEGNDVIGSDVIRRGCHRRRGRWMISQEVTSLDEGDDVTGVWETSRGWRCGGRGRGYPECGKL